MTTHHLYNRLASTAKVLTLALTLALLTGATGCQQSIARVDDALLPDAPAGHMVVVRQARVDRDTAKDNHAKARRNIQISIDQLNLARSEVNVALSQLSDAKLNLDMAKKNGTTNQVDIANEQYQHVSSKVQTARKLLPVREAQIEHAKLLEQLAAQKVLLAEAQVELAKANAVKASGRTEANKISIDTFQRQVDAKKEAVNAAQEKANQSAQSIKQTKQQYQAQKAKARR